MGIKYKEVADQLRHEILVQNTYARTKKLPTEQELMERYHVSRQTVRQALSILLAENLIQKRQGSGTYLSEQAARSGGNAFDIPFDRQQLADYLNVERSALSKELGRMKNEGLIDYRKNHFELIEK